MSPRRAKAIRGRVDTDPATALRQQLIDATEALLTEKQVGAITTREIARRAGVSDGVLYNYFADKSELVIEALAARLGRALGAFDAGLPAPGTGSVRDNLIAYVTATHELVAGTLPMAAGLMSEPALLHRFIAAIHSETLGPHRLQQPIAEYLSAEQKLGRLGSFPLETVFSMIMGSAIMLGFTELVGGVAHHELTAGIPAIVDTLLRGIAPTG
jgi:AcrR family transcriptional regulator